MVSSDNLFFKEHPTVLHYKGNQESRDWIFDTKDYYPSFFKFWNKCKKELKLELEDIKKMDRKYRLNLINSLSGIKPANLIGTRTKSGINNLAIFSSVVHLGSNPAQFGFILRPQTKNPRDTFRNIQETNFYTINHVSHLMIRKAHYTSAKLKFEESEFERMNIEEEFLDGFPCNNNYFAKFLDGFSAPFVKNSKVKMGMKFIDNLLLPNGCSIVIGEAVKIIFPKEAINDLGQLNLESYSCAGISGLNTYYSLRKLQSFPYVRNDEFPDFMNDQ